MNWQAWAVAVCVTIVCIAVAFAGICILGYFIRPGL
jgi:hypothetical protein